MKKIEDLAGSGAKYAGVKVKAEMWGTAESFSTVVYAGEDHFIARRPNKTEVCHMLHTGDNWFVYEEPKQTVLEPWLVKESLSDFPHFRILFLESEDVLGKTSPPSRFIRKLTPEELASGKIVLGD